MFFEPAGQPDTGDRDHDHDDGKRPFHPSQESDLDPRIFRVDFHENQVGRRTDRRTQTTDIGGKCDPQQKTHFHAAVGYFFRDRQYDRQQHQRGRGIRYPHAEDGGGGHKAEYQSPGTVSAKCVNHAQRDPAVSAASRQRRGEHESAQQQQNQRAAISLTDLAGSQYADQRQNRQRYQGSRRYRNGFEDPPQRTDQRDAGSPGNLRCRSAIKQPKTERGRQ